MGLLIFWEFHVDLGLAKSDLELHAERRADTINCIQLAVDINCISIEVAGLNSNIIGLVLLGYADHFEVDLQQQQIVHLIQTTHLLSS